MDNNFNRIEVRLEDLCKVITKGTTPTTLKFSFMQEGVSFIKVESLDADGKVIPQKVAYITRECHEALRRSQLIENDILFSIAGALGRVGIVKEDYLPANTNQALAIIRLLNCNYTLPRYIQYYLQSPKIYSQINKFKVGVAQLNLSLEQTKDFKVILCSFKEQKRIVAKIESLFSRLDSAKDSLERVQQEIKRYRQSVLKSAFEIESKKRKIGDFTIKVGSGATPKGGKNVYQATGIPLIRSMNVHFCGFKLKGLAFINKKQANELRNVEVHGNDVLLNITGASIGRVCVAPSDMEGARVNQHVCIIRPDKTIESKFLALFLSSSRIQHFIQRENVGATRQALTKTMVLNVEVPDIDPKQQNKIVQAVESHFDRAEVLEDAVEQGLEKIEQLKQSILKKAFEGKLVELDPNDESVEVLLKRIKKEKDRLEGRLGR
jgi:restriction endonuclease S subunit